MIKVFISYSQKDIEFTKRLTGELNKTNWISECINPCNPQKISTLGNHSDNGRVIETLTLLGCK